MGGIGWVSIGFQGFIVNKVVDSWLHNRVWPGEKLIIKSNILRFKNPVFIPYILMSSEI